ncbi:MAG: SPOR domain-containing protein [Thermodesulfovibrio sp.]
MKKKGEELVVLQKKTFFLILFIMAVIGVLVGYTIGYVTAPVKQVYVQKNTEAEKSVLPVTSESQQAKKQENTTQQEKSETTEKETVKIIQEIEATEKTQAQETKEKLKTVKTEKLNLKKVVYKRPVYTLQVGAFHESENAEKLIKTLSENGIISQLVRENLYKVRTGYYKRFKDAQKASEILKAKGFDNFIVKIN